MEKEKSKIRVLDVQSGQTLFECSFAESEQAYHFAAQMEEMGLDVKVVSPSLTQSLTTALGLSALEAAEYMESVEEEIEQHDGSCCFEDKDKPLQ